MKYRPRTQIRSIPILFLFLLATGAGISSTVMATALPIRGGNGGVEFTDICPAGFYLVGFDGRNGAWVDQLATICAPWLSHQRTFGQVVTGSLHGTSQGGIFNRRICPTNRAISGLDIFPTIKDNRHELHFLGTVHVSCDNVEPPSLKVNLQIKSGFAFGCVGRNECLTGEPRETWRDFCPEGEIAIGIRGRAGLFLDALGLVCGPRPPKPGAPVVKLPDSLIQTLYPAAPINPQAHNIRIPDDMFVITKPSAMDTVQQGQLIVTATAPKIGATGFAELELRYLDAPPNQRDSYPYLTILSIETNKLSQGYLVDQIVTGGYIGHWQVRARSSMKTPPGAWSPSVQFQMVKAQPAPPTPPMVQQAPLPNSSIMSPPVTSPQPQIKRSPFMVRPRGVEGEPAGPKEESPATESK